MHFDCYNRLNNAKFTWFFSFNFTIFNRNFYLIYSQNNQPSQWKEPYSNKCRCMAYNVLFTSNSVAMNMRKYTKCGKWILYQITFANDLIWRLLLCWHLSRLYNCDTGSTQKHDTSLNFVRWRWQFKVADKLTIYWFLFELINCFVVRD